MYKLIAVAALLASATWSTANVAVAAGTAAPAGAYAYIGYPNDGQVIPAGPAPAGVPAIKTTIPTAKPVPEPAAPPVQD